MTLPVHVLDDDESVLQACGFLLQTLGYDAQLWPDPRAFFAAVDMCRAGIVITDWNMPWLNGEAVQDKLLECASPMALIVLTGFGEVPLAVSMMKKGAVDFLEKPVSLPRLQAALNAAQALTEAACALQRNRCLFAALSEKEQAVAALVVAGYTNKAMAAMLHVAVRTVEVHRANIMHKMQAEHLPDLVQKLGPVLDEHGTIARI